VRNTVQRCGLGLILLGLGISLGMPAEQANEAEIRRYTEQAQQAMSARNLEAASAALETLTRLTPNVPEVYANLGMVYYTEGRYAPAEASFRRALALNPKIPNVPLMLAICDAGLGRSKEAMPILEAAFRHPPNDAIGRTVGLELLGVYASLGLHLKALETVETLLDRFPNDPEILYRASHTYGDRALQTMTRLADVAPESPWKEMAFAEALEAQKHYDLAITEYQKVIASDAGIPGVHFRLGRALLLRAPDSEDARDAALKEFQQALALDPRNAGAEYEIGEICRRRGQREEAVGHFARAVEIDPRFEEAQIALARTLIDLHQPGDALTHLRTAVQLNPTNEVTHFLLASAYKAAGDAAESQKELALYQKYHTEPFANESASGTPTAPALAAPEVTRQTLDTENPTP